MNSRLPPVLVRRLTRELDLLHTSPPPYVAAWPASDPAHNDADAAATRLDVLEAEIRGAPGTPYADGRFRLAVHVPLRYPFEPPKVRFTTPIYHPNIDSGGRICLDTLNMPPKGSWKPSVNLCTVLATVQQLMGEPNTDDGLMAEITEQYRCDRRAFERVAREWTARYAMGGGGGGAGGEAATAGECGGSRVVADGGGGSGCALAGDDDGDDEGEEEGGEAAEDDAERGAKTARRKRLRLGDSGDAAGEERRSG